MPSGLNQRNSRLERLVELGLSLAGSETEEDLLARLADAARELANARYAAIGVRGEGGKLSAFITSGMDEQTRARIGPLPEGRGLLGVIAEDGPLRLDDLSTDPRSVGFPPGHPPMTTFLGAPIMLGGEPYGSIYVTEHVDGAFTDADERIIKTLAVYAAMAISHATRFDEQREMVDGLERICTITHSMRSELGERKILTDVTRQARALLACETVGVGRCDGDHVRFRHAHGSQGLQLESVAPDASGIDDLGQGLKDALGCRYAAVAPIGSEDGDVGVLVALSNSRLSSWRQRALTVLADQLGAVLTSARNFSEQQQRLVVDADERVRKIQARMGAETRRRVLAAQESERSRIARELHDETGQLITGLSLRLKALSEQCRPELRDEVSALREHVKDVSAALGEALRRLRPAALDRGLTEAIRAQANTVNESSGCSVEVRIGSLPPLSDQTELVLFRAAQEALTNVARHSRAAHATVALESHGNRLRLVVEDDGIGFEPSTEHDRLGLAGIAERVSIVNGELHISSAIGGGTAVVVDLPTVPGAPDGEPAQA